MKISELKQIIKEEIVKALAEDNTQSLIDNVKKRSYFDFLEDIKDINDFKKETEETPNLKGPGIMGFSPSTNTLFLASPSKSRLENLRGFLRTNTKSFKEDKVKNWLNTDMFLYIFELNI